MRKIGQGSSIGAFAIAAIKARSVWKTLLLGLFGWVCLSSSAMATCTSYPTTLMNNSTADANIVMGDFNYMMGCAAPIASPSFTGSVSGGGVTLNGTAVVPTAANSNIGFNATGTGGTFLGTGGSTGGVIIGNSAGSAAITIGQSGSTGAVRIGNSTGSTAITGGITVTGAVNFNSLTNTTGVYVCATGALITWEATSCVPSNKDLKNPMGALDASTAAEKLNNLGPGQIFSYKDQKLYGAGIHVGLYAQDVEKMDPRCVSYNAKGVIQNYDSNCLIAYLITSRLADRAELAQLRHQVTDDSAKLKASGDKQAAEIEQLKTQMGSLERKVGFRTAQN